MADHNGLEIVTIAAGPIETNTFLVIDSATNDTLVIDAPPDSLAALELEIAERNATPIALVRWATTGAQKTITGTLADMADTAEKENFGSPAVAVIGTSSMSAPVTVSGTRANRKSLAAAETAPGSFAGSRKTYAPGVTRENEKLPSGASVADTADPGTAGTG